MIRKDERIRRATTADGTITDVIRAALADNFARIPFTREGGFIATDISESGSEDDLHVTICGYMPTPGQMCQEVCVIYFDTKEKADLFRCSPEGRFFDDPYGQGQDSFEFSTYAGNSALPELIATILRNYFDIRDTSHIVAETYCKVDYFRKDPDDAPPRPMLS